MSDSKLAVVPDAAVPAQALRPPVPPASLAHRELLGGEFWQRIPAYANVDRGEVPRPQLAGEELDHRTSASCWRRCEGLVSDGVLRRRARRGFAARADERARVAVPAVADRLERPVRRSAAPPVHPASRRASCPITRSSTLDSLHEQADAPVPGLTHRYPDKALFLALDTCPVYCRFCTRSYAVGVDTEEVEKVQLKVNDERWAAGLRLHRVAARARGHRHLGRRRLPAAARADHADRRDAARHAQHPAHPLRDQGPGGDAAEDPHRRRVDRTR